MNRPDTWQVKLTATSAPAATVLIRLYVGAVFLSEGILKFLRPDAQGTGRFDKAGIPAPGFFAPLDGVFEIACGLLILAGLLTRLAVIPAVRGQVGLVGLRPRIAHRPRPAVRQPVPPGCRRRRALARRPPDPRGRLPDCRR